MATAYKTPGVYVEEISKFPPSIAQVETAIPAFIGYTQKAENEKGEDLVLKPTRIKALLDYEELFGTAPAESDIAVTVNETVTGTDPNTKRVSIDATAALATADRSLFRLYYAMQLFFANGGGPCYVISIGLIGDASDALDKADFEAGLSRLELEDEPTMIVFPEAPLLDAGDYYDLQKDALGQCAKLGDRFAIIDVKPNGSTDAAAETFRNEIGVNNLKYGAAYYPDLVTSIDFIYEPSEVDVTINTTNADTGDESSEDKTLDEILDTDKDTQIFNVAKREIERLEMPLPPSPAIAGVYSYVDRTRGVWKAPANVSLDRVIRPAVKISHDDQQDLNVHTSGKSINAIRSFTGRGILVWGARTLAGNDNEWRYVPVRRFFNMVEESTKKATAQFVFEPNDANTWVKVRSMIENFLLLQWRAGALAGSKPEQAFFVKVGLGETMTALDILEGRMIVEIGMAVVRPAEFIILRFMHKMQEA